MSDNQSGGVNVSGGNTLNTGNIAGRDLTITQQSPAPIAYSLHQLPSPDRVFILPCIAHGQRLSAENVERNDEAAKACNWYAGQWSVDVLRLHPRVYIQWIESAFIAARKLKNRQAEGAHLGNLGLAYADLGETRKAIEFQEQRLKIVREIGDRRGEGEALGNLGIAYKNLGETCKAVEIYDQRLRIAREIGDRRGEGTALWNMGLALDKLGERNKAIEYAEVALKIWTAIETPNAERARKKLAEWKH